MRNLSALLLFTFAASTVAAQGTSHTPDFMMMMRLAKLQALVTGQGSDMARQIRFAIIELRNASPGATITYPNGQTATSWAHQEGATLYYPNGQTATSWARREGATWYYPNGQTATSWVHRKDATWYHPNGQTLTSWAGKVGATWYHHNGRTATSWAGQRGATWYDANGSVLFSNGPELDENELLNVPRVALQYLWVEEDESF